MGQEIATAEQLAACRRRTEEAGRPLVGAAERGDRPGRAVVVHNLRGVCGAMPGRHRARRPHRGHAPLPGDDGVGDPNRDRHHAAEPGEQGQPVGPEPATTARTGPRASASRCVAPGEIPDDVEYLFWVGCAGALDDRAKQTTGPSRSCCTPRASIRDPRQGRDLHGRPGPAHGQRVRLSGARAAEHRDARRGVRSPDVPPIRSSQAARTVQHHRQRVPAARRGVQVIHHTQLLSELVAERD